ncbi:MAG: 4Fe-4S dicluster domain-containing protein [bacterium]
MVKVDLKFRDRLAEMIGGELHNLCYQCGSCVADCAAARYSDEFNPRLIVLKTLLGMEDDLIKPDSLIWECTNCFTCFERCPQGVKPIEVIIALKNMMHDRKFSPDAVKSIITSVVETGRTAIVNDTVKRRREELGLPPLKKPPVDELLPLMKPGMEGSDG